MPDPTPPNGVTLLNTQQAAAFLTLAPITLAEWRLTGKGPRFSKIGRSVRYRLDDLKAWLESRTFGNTAEAKAGV